MDDRLPHAPRNRFAALRGRDSLIGQGLRFLTLTGTSAVVSIGTPVFLHEVLGVRPEIAVAVGFVVSFLFNFLTVRRLVFASRNSLAKDFGLFAGSTAAFRGLEYLLFLALYRELNYIVALVVALVVSSVAKFFWYRRTMHRRPAAAEVS